MSPGAPRLSERQLMSLWLAVREAATLVGRDASDLPGPSPLMQALATDARRLADELDGTLRHHRADLARAGPAERMKVLLVDDDPCALTAMKALLAPEFDVSTTSQPGDVPHLVEQLHPDAIVTDLYMPEIDGLTLIDLLRGSGCSALPVLVVTAATDTTRQLEALELGAFDFLTKPVDVADLSARIHRAVRHARELQHQRVLQQTDDLTGLLNRRAFNDVLRLGLSDRRSKPGLALALIDVDGLKQINDAWGHPTGDRAIMAVAHALDRARRASDFAARIGGDEFALVMPGADLAAAQRVVARVDDALSGQPLVLADGTQLNVRVSSGISTCTGPGCAPADLFAPADEALYAMKRARHPADAH